MWMIQGVHGGLAFVWYLPPHADFLKSDAFEKARGFLGIVPPPADAEQRALQSPGPTECP